MAAAGHDVHAAQFGLEDFSEFTDGMPVLEEEDEEEMASSYPGVAVILGSSHDLGIGTLYITTRCTARPFSTSKALAFTLGASSGDTCQTL